MARHVGNWKQKKTMRILWRIIWLWQSLTPVFTFTRPLENVATDRIFFSLWRWATDLYSIWIVAEVRLFHCCDIRPGIVWDRNTLVVMYVARVVCNRSLGIFGHRVSLATLDHRFVSVSKDEYGDLCNMAAWTTSGIHCMAIVRVPGLCNPEK